MLVKMDIFKIIRKNNVEIFKNAIDTDENLLYVKDSFGSNVLHKAVFWNCNEIVKYLCENEKLRSETDNDGYTVYHKAALGNNEEAVRLLGVSEMLTFRNKANEMPIITASKMNNNALFDIMLEKLNYKDSEQILSIDNMTPRMRYYINKKFTIKEPVMLYPRDDLIDPYTLEDISPGVLYAVRFDGRSFYCLGSAETVETMLKSKYKSNNEDMVFDMIQNQAVPIDTILFCIKNDCPSVVKKIFDKSFTDEDIDLEFKDENYDGDNQLCFAKMYKNDIAIKLIEEAMKKD